MGASFVYVPRPRGCLSFVLDAAVLASLVLMVRSEARHDELRCRWDGPTASCVTETISALSLTTRRSVDGIRGLAYRSGTSVGVVTDARNKDELASFGTRQIDMWSDGAAAALAGFIDARSAPLELEHGPRQPALVTGAALLAVLLYAFATRRRSARITIDRAAVLIEERALFTRSTRRVPLAGVEGFDVEGGDERHRVRLALRDGERIPLARALYRGDHHATLAEQLNDALARARDLGAEEGT